MRNFAIKDLGTQLSRDIVRRKITRKVFIGIATRIEKVLRK